MHELPQTPGANKPLSFERNLAKAGSAIDYSPDTKSFILSESGLYEIHYQSMCSGEPSTEANSVLGLIMMDNGNPVKGGMSAVSINSSKESVLLTQVAIINVTAPPANISLITGHTGGAFGSTTIIIRKLT